VHAAKNPLTGLISGLATGAVALFAYARLVGRLERRSTPEVTPFSLRSLSYDTAIATLGLMIGVAVCEEILFRGVLFRIVVAVGLLFGGLHLINPSATCGARWRSPSRVACCRPAASC
jgi:membrane protease YdiL (CAAX protease family)